MWDTCQFNSVLQENLKSWAEYSKAHIPALIHELIRKKHKSVDDESNKGTCQNMEMFVGLTVKADYVCDARLCLEEVQASNRGMVPASKSSVIQLPERMEIDEDQCLNDHDCVICFEPLGNEGKKILCMPCSHMFHGDCITKWLDQSHCCPICRYDLPTAELLDS